MPTEEVIDYAMPCMMAERALKAAHSAVLDGKLDTAMDHALQAIADSRLMYHSLKVMKEKQDAIDLR
jgi:hypothetical protein